MNPKTLSALFIPLFFALQAHAQTPSPSPADSSSSIMRFKTPQMLEVERLALSLQSLRPATPSPDHSERERAILPYKWVGRIQNVVKTYMIGANASGGEYSLSAGLKDITLTDGVRMLVKGRFGLMPDLNFAEGSSYKSNLYFKLEYDLSDIEVFSQINIKLEGESNVSLLHIKTPSVLESNTLLNMNGSLRLSIFGTFSY